MLRATRAANSLGSAMASSNELVCRLCVPPNTAASASTVVRTMLLYGSCSVSETPEVWQCVRNIDDPGFFGLNSAMTRAQSRRAARSLDTSMKKSMPMAKKNDRRPANEIDVEPAVDRRAHILEPVSDRERQLLHRRRAGLLHVVAGDRDRVELRHPPRRVVDDVGHDPHARLGRIDVGVADHELFEDVVLDGPGELVLAHTLFLGRHHVSREHREHSAVHGHRHGHLVERDLVEEDLHVLDRVDGDAGLADVADHPRVVAVVPSVASRGRTPPTGPSDRRPGWRDRTRSTPRQSRSPRTGGWSMAGWHTSWPAHRGEMARTRASCRPLRALPDRPRCRAAATGMPSGVIHVSVDGSPLTSLAASSCQSARVGRSLSPIPERVRRTHGGGEVGRGARGQLARDIGSAVWAFSNARRAAAMPSRPTRRVRASRRHSPQLAARRAGWVVRAARWAFTGASTRRSCVVIEGSSPGGTTLIPRVGRLVDWGP